MNDFEKITIAPVKDESSSLDIRENDGKWETSAFFLDSSGRSSIPISILLKSPSSELIEKLKAIQCIGEDKNAGGEDQKEEPREYSLDVEAKASLSEKDTKQAFVEDVKVTATRIEQESAILDIVIYLRIAGSQSIQFSSETKITLDVTAVLSRKLQSDEPVKSSYFMHSFSKHRIEQKRLQPFQLRVSLAHAFSIATKSMDGPTPGSSLVSLSMKHTDTHTQPVTISNIALHPGHSIQTDAETRDVCDMTKVIQWNYLDQCGPNLPLTLHPNETFSTIIQVNAASDTVARQFSSPISVTAVVGDTKHKLVVLAAADVRWKTAPATIEPANAFMMNLSLVDHECKVGVTSSVNFTISSLGAESRKVKVSLEGSASTTASKFGISTDSRTNGIVFVDQSIDLEVPASGSVSGSLRFIPIRSGIVIIPPLLISNEDEYICRHSLSISVV